MNNILETHLKPILDSIGTGSVFGMVIGSVLRVLAVLLVIGLLIGWFMAFRLLGHATFLTGVVILIYQMFMLAAILLIGATIFVRGDTILKLEPAQFTLIPIFAIVLRLAGEVGLIFWAAMSIPFMLAMWVGAGHLVTMPIGLPHNAFVAGILCFLFSLLLGFISLAVMYLLAEIVEVVYRMAVDVRGARTALEVRSTSNTEGAIRHHHPNAETEATPEAPVRAE